MNWRGIRQRINLFDKTGLDLDTVKNLQLLIVSVMGGVVWSNITNSIAMTGYLRALGASDFVYGLVIAMAPLANAFQFLASYWMERTLKRRTLFLVAGFIQRLVWFPFALVPFLIPMETSQLRLWAAMICVLVSAGMAPFMNVSFYSICADVIPMRIRSRYFATRSRISTAMGLIVGIVMGVMLDRVAGFAGYTAVFIIAAVFGTADIFCFLFMNLPKMRPTTTKTGLFKMLRNVFLDKSYMKTILCLTAWFFSVQLSAPYFNVYMMERMRMSNLQIIMYSQAIANLALIVIINRWGRALDQYGNKPMLRIAATLTSFMPLIFFFAGEGMIYMVFIANLLSGLTYCCIDLGAQNLFMGQAREDNKSMYFAVYFIFTQLAGIALGTSAGGWLLDNVLPAVEGLNLSIGRVQLTRYNWLFLLSWALRFLVALVLLPLISEPDTQSVRVVLNDFRMASTHKFQRLRMEVIRFFARRSYYKKKYGGDTK